MTMQVQTHDGVARVRDIARESGHRLTLMDFSAETRCAACRALAPVLDKLSEELGDQIEVVKIDVDTERELAAKYRIKGIPTLKIISNGEVLATSVGAQSYSSLLNFVAPYLDQSVSA